MTTFPLIDRLTSDHGLPLIDDLAAINAGLWVLFFPGNPTQHRESLDVAVILPELLRAFAWRLSGAVVAPAADSALAAQCGVFVHPCLVFLRDGEVIHTIPKVRDWADYVRDITGLLAEAA